eukprot:g4506.t1
MGQVCSGDRKAGVDKLDPLTYGRKPLDGQRTIVEYDSPFQSPPSPALPSSPETEKMTNSDEEFIMELNRQHMDQYRRRKSVTKLVIEEAVNNAEKVAASVLRRESIQSASRNDQQEETNSRNGRQQEKDGRTDQQEETNGSNSNRLDDNLNVDIQTQRSLAFASISSPLNDETIGMATFTSTQQEPEPASTSAILEDAAPGILTEGTNVNSSTIPDSTIGDEDESMIYNPPPPTKSKVSEISDALIQSGKSQRQTLGSKDIASDDKEVDNLMRGKASDVPISETSDVSKIASSRKSPDQAVSRSPRSRRSRRSAQDGDTPPRESSRNSRRRSKVAKEEEEEMKSSTTGKQRTSRRARKTKDAVTTDATTIASTEMNVNVNKLEESEESKTKGRPRKRKTAKERAAERAARAVERAKLRFAKRREAQRSRAGTESMADIRKRLKKESMARIGGALNNTSGSKSHEFGQQGINQETPESITKRYLNQAKEQLKSEHSIIGKKERTMDDIHQDRENKLNKKESDLLDRENKLLELEKDIIRKLQAQQDNLLLNLNKVKGEYSRMKTDGNATTNTLRVKAKELEELEKETQLKKKLVDKELQQRKNSIVAIQERRKSSITPSEEDLQSVEKLVQRRHSQLQDSDFEDVKVVKDVNEVLVME